MVSPVHQTPEMPKDFEFFMLFTPPVAASSLG